MALSYLFTPHLCVGYLGSLLLPSFGSRMILYENIINLWASALADLSNAFKRWGETGDWRGCGLGRAVVKVGIITARPIILSWLLSFGLDLFIHSRNIYKISAMCWTLEIQFIYSSFHSAVLNVPPVSAAPRRPCIVLSVQKQGLEPWPQGMKTVTTTSSSWREEATGRGSFNSNLGSTGGYTGYFEPKETNNAPNTPGFYTFFKWRCYLNLLL